MDVERSPGPVPVPIAAGACVGLAAGSKANRFPDASKLADAVILAGSA